MSECFTRRQFIQTTVKGAVAAAVTTLGGETAATLAVEKSQKPGTLASAPGGGTKRFEIPVRYIPHDVEYDTIRDEVDWRQVERRVSYGPGLSALVLVDIWNYWTVPTEGARINKIISECIQPVAAACRQNGILVVHAPAPAVAFKYPKFRFWPEAKWNQPPIYARRKPSRIGPPRKCKLDRDPSRTTT